MKKRAPTPPRLVVCVRNDDYELDLAVNSVYEVLPDPSAERSGWIRIVDETGEDYLYPEKFFRAAEGASALTGELRRAS
jgi:hypothetical protein